MPEQPAEPLPLDELTRRLRDHVDSLRRPGWIPRVEPIADPSDPALRTASHFCGPPYLPAGEDWPMCECGRPLQLFVQLDLAELPDGATADGDAGLLQVFYHHLPVETPEGTECYAEPAWEPFDESHKRVRIVRPDGDSQPSDGNNSSEFSPTRIVGWTRIEDAPEFQETGIEVEFGFGGEDRSVACEAIGLSRTLTADDTVDGTPYLDFLLAEDDEDDDDDFEPYDGDDPDAEPIEGDEPATAPLPAPRGGDKLGGWPAWVQGIEYPDCPECGEPMAAILQIDSEDHVAYMFGDYGTAHVFRCRTHPDVVTMSWACG